MLMLKVCFAKYTNEKPNLNTNLRLGVECFVIEPYLSPLEKQSLPVYRAFIMR